MKKITLIFDLDALMMPAPAYAGVSKIQNNGKIGDSRSYRPNGNKLA